MKISLFVLSYNSESFIEKNLYSIIKQDLSNFDIFVNDDASTDASVRVINEFHNRNIDITKDWTFNFNQNNVGINACLKNLLHKNNNPWVKVIAGDDEFSKGALKIYEGYSNKLDPLSSIVISDMEIINENSDHIGYRKACTKFIYTNSFISPINFYVNTITAPTVMIGSKNLLNALNQTKVKNAEDWPILSYSIRYSLNFDVISAKLVKYRIHDSSLSSSYNFNKPSFDISNKIKEEVIILLKENYERTNNVFAWIGIYLQLKKLMSKNKFAYFFYTCMKIINPQYVIFRLINWPKK